MVQKIAYGMATALVTFGLVLVGGIALRLAQPSAVATGRPIATIAMPTVAPPTATAAPTVDVGMVKAQIVQRDQDYQQIVDAANRQLREANERLQHAYLHQQTLEDQLRQVEALRLVAEAQALERQPLSAPRPSVAEPPSIPISVLIAPAPAPGLAAKAIHSAPAPAPTDDEPDDMGDIEDDGTPEAVASPVPALHPPSIAPATPTAPAYAVSPQQAVAIALAATPGAAVTGEPELVSYQGTPAYEVALNGGLVYIDANSGHVLHNGAHPTPTATPVPPKGITPEQAAATARDYLGRGTVTKVELTTERNVKAYVVSFSDGGKVYVHATTGEVIYAKKADKKPKSPERSKPGDDHERDDHDSDD